MARQRITTTIRDISTPPPYINKETDTWWIHDGERYVDTTLPARGPKGDPGAVDEETLNELTRANERALEEAKRAYERAMTAGRYHGMRGDYDAAIKYPYTDRETSVVIYKGVPYLLIGEHTAGVAPDSTEGKKVWQALHGMDSVYARKVLADFAQIGDMKLYNGEGDDDYIAFEESKEGDIHRYMQIGGRAKTEAEMLDASTSMVEYRLTDTSIYRTTKQKIDGFICKESNSHIRYTGTLTATAIAAGRMDGNNVVIHGDSASVTVIMSLVVKTKAGSKRYEASTTPLMASAWVESKNTSSVESIPPFIDVIDNDTETMTFALSAPGAKVSKGDIVELYAEVNSNGVRNTVRISDLRSYLPEDKSRSLVTVTRERMSLFFGRTKYVLFNYLSDWLMKVVGNVLVQGNLKVVGDVSADFVDTSGAVLAGGEVNGYGTVMTSFGRYKNHRTRGVPHVEKLGSGASCYTRVHHSIGSDKYVPFVTPLNVPYSDQPSIVLKTDYYFDVRFYNGSGQSYHYPFHYVCHKAD